MPTTSFPGDSPRPAPRAPRPLIVAAASIAAAFAGVGCGSSSNNNGDGAVGGPVSGPADMHCAGRETIVVNAASCSVTAHDDAGAHNDDGGATGEDGGGHVHGDDAAEEMAETMFNAEGDDDDCKYHVAFSATPAVKVNGTMTFRMTLTKKADGAPATGAIDAQGNGVTIEAYLADNNFHVLPNTTPAMSAVETPAGSGVYTIMPVKFDASGRWVVRFHFFETCSDELPDSPHGHAAFFFDVP